GAVRTPQVHPGAPMTAVTAALGDEALHEETLREPRVPRLGLFQNETWELEFDDVPIYGNGALH
ncbi:MAG: hypothetical protein ACRDRK_19725, partial [Pseudonocardia sp.]